MGAPVAKGSNTRHRLTHMSVRASSKELRVQQALPPQKKLLQLEIGCKSRTIKFAKRRADMTTGLMRNVVLLPISVDPADYWELRASRKHHFRNNVTCSTLACFGGVIQQLRLQRRCPMKLESATSISRVSETPRDRAQEAQQSQSLTHLTWTTNWSLSQN